MKVLLLCHADLIPQHKSVSLLKAENEAWRTEYFVFDALRKLGHKVDFCGLDDQLRPLREKIQTFKPDIVFTLLEEFAGEALLEFFAVSFLEKNRIPYTGCGSEALILCKNKLLAKKILSQAGIKVPGDFRYPKIVKYVAEESSLGITDKSIVKNKMEEKRQKDRLQHQLASKVFSEEYIPGREIHLAVLSTPKKMLIFPPLETDFGKKSGPPIMTAKVKWDFKRRKKNNIKLKPLLHLNKEINEKLMRDASLACQSMQINGPARLDFRLNHSGDLFLLEINPNPDLARWDEYATAARLGGMPYEKLIDEILQNHN